MLLSHDILKNGWHEETINCDPLLFEWDGRLMALEIKDVDLDNEQKFMEWDLMRRMWKDTGINMPRKILKKIQCDFVGFSIVASGNHLAVIGLIDDAEFKIAVYKRAENY